MSVIVVCSPGGHTSVSSSCSGIDGRVGIELLVALDDGGSEALIVINVGERRALDSFASDPFLAVCG